MTVHVLCDSLCDLCPILISFMNFLVVRFGGKDSDHGKHWLNKGPRCKIWCWVIILLMFVTEKLIYCINTSSISFDWLSPSPFWQNGNCPDCCCVFLIRIIHASPLIHSKKLQKCQHLVHRVAQCSDLSQIPQTGSQKRRFFSFLVILVMRVLSQPLFSDDLRSFINWFNSDLNFIISRIIAD